MDFAGAIYLEDVLAGRGFGLEGLLDAEDAPVALVELLDGLQFIFVRLFNESDDELLEAIWACLRLFHEAAVFIIRASVVAAPSLGFGRRRWIGILLPRSDMTSVRSASNNPLAL